MRPVKLRVLKRAQAHQPSDKRRWQRHLSDGRRDHPESIPRVSGRVPTTCGMGWRREGGASHGERRKGIVLFGDRAVRPPRVPCSPPPGPGIRCTFASSFPTAARKAHWSWNGTRSLSTKTLLPTRRGRRWRGNAIRLPKPPRGRVSWLGKNRSYERKPRSGRSSIASVSSNAPRRRATRRRHRTGRRRSIHGRRRPTGNVPALKARQALHRHPSRHRASAAQVRAVEVDRKGSDTSRRAASGRRPSRTACPGRPHPDRCQRISVVSDR